MATIVTRSGKGSPLTNAEVDGNFTNLNTELGTKANTSSLATVATTGAYADLTGKPINVSSFANDSAYITSAALSPYLTSSTAASTYQPLDGDLTAIAALAGTTGLIRKTAANTYSLDTATYLTGITSGQVTTALGFTPYNASNPAGYITGITSGNVTTALGYTPYNATNPAGYITSSGSISGNAATATNISNTGTVTLASATESNSIYATAPSYTADQPTKLLNFDWYGNVFSLGNIRSGSTPSSGFGVYYTPSGGSRAELMRVDTSGNVLINRTSASGIGKLNVEGGVDVTSGNITVQAGYGIAWRGDQSRIMTPDDNSYGALIRWGATGGCRLFESTTERLRIDGTGSVRAFVDFRAPIFYDSNDTGRYLDPSSTSVLTTVEAYNGSGFRSYSTPSSGINSQIYFANAANTRAWNWQLDENNNAALWGFNGTTWAKRMGVTNSSELYLRNTSGTDILAAYPSTFGYSSGYRTLVLGNQAYTTVCIGVDPVANASGSFNGAGSGVEVMFKNGAYFISPNSANNSYNNYLQLVDGIVVVTNYLQATSSLRAPLFYDSDNTSYFVDPTSTSRLSVANVNFMTLLNDEGLNVKGIRGQFAAGSDGQGISLFSNVDIGYPSGWGSGLGNTPSRGLSVYGGLRVAYSGDGFITSDTSVRSPIFYDSNNTGYYVDPASTSVQYRINVLNGINLTGGIALTSSGATLDNSIAMRLTENYGALWNGGDGTLWHHQVINASMLCGFTGAGANWGSGRVVASNDVRGTLFYDYNNTAYYVDPNSTSVLNSLSVNGGAVYRSDWTTRFQSPSDFVDGTLVTTDIPATGFEGNSFVIEITGKSYDGSNPPFKVVAQGYLYNNTIINYSGASYAGNFASYVKVFEDGGVLKFWWPRISYWNSFNVNVMSMDGQTNGTITRNRVTAIGNSTEPTGTKKQQINLIKTLKTGDAAGSISGFNNPTTAPTANTIVYRDAAGDISAREIVLSSGLSAQTPTVLVSMYPSTNQLVRTTPAAVAASMGALTTGNYTSYAMPSGSSATNSVDVRAPIFYDSNNTGYYVDPAGTSSVTNLLLADTGAIQFNDRGRDANTVTNPQWSPRSVRWDFVGAGSVGTGGNYAGLMTFVPWVGTTSSTGDASYQMAWGSTGANGTGVPHLRIRKGIDATWNSFYSIHHDGFDQPLYAAASFRAPIFYDSNDTNYYLDPASTSNLNRLVLSARNDNYFVGSMAALNTVTNFQSLTNTYGQMTVMQCNDINGFTNAPTGLYQYGAVMSWRTENHSYQMYASHTGDIAYKTQWANDNYSGWLTPMVYGRNGGSSSGKTVYGSIYYDSDNTGYYSDPSSTSRTGMINADNLRTQNNVYIDQQYGSSLVGAYNSVRYQGVYAMGDAYKLAIDGTTAGNLYGIAWAHPNAGGVAANLNTHGALFLENGGFLAAVSGSIRSRDDMRTPIYYDIGDTFYYINPNGNSVLYKFENINQRCAYDRAWDNYPSITVRNTTDQGPQGDFRIHGIGGVNGGDFNVRLLVDGTVQSLSDVQAPIFYDSNNTGYYLDPNSTGTSLNVAGSIIAAGNVTAYSDRRLKNNIQQMTSALDKVSQLLGVTFTRNDLADTTRRYGGLLAQDVEKVLPEAVHDIGGTLGVDYNATIGLLVEAIKELRDEVEMLRK